MVTLACAVTRVTRAYQHLPDLPWGFHGAGSGWLDSWKAAGRAGGKLMVER
jgi:hypothetical protein